MRQLLLQMKRKWRIDTLPAHERFEILKKTAELILKNADELAQLIAKEGGKPLKMLCLRLIVLHRL